MEIIGHNQLIKNLTQDSVDSHKEYLKKYIEDGGRFLVLWIFKRTDNFKIFYKPGDKYEDITNYIAAICKLKFNQENWTIPISGGNLDKSLYIMELLDMNLNLPDHSAKRDVSYIYK